MVLQIFCVHDRAVGAYMQPFFARSEGEAVRMLSQATNTPDTAFHSNPSDYTLIHIGEWSDQTAEFNTIPPSAKINLSSLKPQV